MMSQPQYASDLLKKFNMDECKASKSPIIYVYYILITCSCTNLIFQIKNSLHSEFAMTDLGLVRQCLGLEIEKNGKGIMLSQP